MKLFLILISFLFFASIAMDNPQATYDAPGETAYVVDITDVSLDISMASIEVDLIAKLKLLDRGGTIVTTEGISPPGVKSPMITNNNRLKFKESMRVVITINNNGADTTTKNSYYADAMNRLGLSSGGMPDRQASSEDLS